MESSPITEQQNVVLDPEREAHEIVDTSTEKEEEEEGAVGGVGVFDEDVRAKSNNKSKNKNSEHPTENVDNHGTNILKGSFEPALAFFNIKFERCIVINELLPSESPVVYGRRSTVPTSNVTSGTEATAPNDQNCCYIANDDVPEDRNEQRPEFENPEFDGRFVITKSKFEANPARPAPKCVLFFSSEEEQNRFHEIFSGPTQETYNKPEVGKKNVTICQSQDIKGHRKDIIDDVDKLVDFINGNEKKGKKKGSGSTKRRNKKGDSAGSLSNKK